MRFLSERSCRSDTRPEVVGTVFEHGGTNSRRLGHHQPGHAILRCGVMAFRAARTVALQRSPVGNCILVAYQILRLAVLLVVR